MAKGYAACHHDHPVLDLPGGLSIRGASCITPQVNDCDVYIGFDRGMRVTTRHFPWTPGTEVLFPIQDMGVPQNVKAFEKLIEWTLDELKEGRTVHCGCIGGHGRTGLFLAALARKADGPKEAIQYVRENYCKKAVESKAQIDWLMEHFDVATAEATKKSGFAYDGSGNAVGFGKSAPYYGKGAGVSKGYTSGGAGFKLGMQDKDVHPIKSSMNIWGETFEDEGNLA